MTGCCNEGFSQPRNTILYNIQSLMKNEYQNIHNYATNKAGDGMSVRPHTGII